MKALTLVAVVTGFTTTVFAQSNRPLTEWEIRTGTSIEAQAERGRRQAAQREAAAKAAADRKQAEEDARNPEIADIRRAKTAFDAAKTLPEKELAYLNLKAAYDRLEARIAAQQARSARYAADAAAEDNATALWLLQQQAAKLRQIQRTLEEQRRR